MIADSVDRFSGKMEKKWFCLGLFLVFSFFLNSLPVFAQLTPKEGRALKNMAPSEKKKLADELLQEEVPDLKQKPSLFKYFSGHCHSTVAFMYFLYGKITYNDLCLGVEGKGAENLFFPRNVFQYELGEKWQKGKAIPAGRAVGFFYNVAVGNDPKDPLPPKGPKESQEAWKKREKEYRSTTLARCFHSAISVGGTEVRGVNAQLSGKDGMLLSAGFGRKTNLDEFFGEMEFDGANKCFILKDGRKVTVWISTFGVNSKIKKKM